MSTVVLVVRCKNRAPSLQPPHSRVLPPPPSGADWSSELRPPPSPFEVCCQVLCTPTRACSWLRFSLSLSLSVTGMGRLEEACVCVCHGSGCGAGMFVHAGVHDGTSPPLALSLSHALSRRVRAGRHGTRSRLPRMRKLLRRHRPFNGQNVCVRERGVCE